MVTVVVAKPEPKVELVTEPAVREPVTAQRVREKAAADAAAGAGGVSTLVRAEATHSVSGHINDADLL